MEGNKHADYNISLSGKTRICLLHGDKYPNRGSLRYYTHYKLLLLKSLFIALLRRYELFTFSLVMEGSIQQLEEMAVLKTIFSIVSRKRSV